MRARWIAAGLVAFPLVGLLAGGTLPGFVVSLVGSGMTGIALREHLDARKASRKEEATT